MSVSAEKIFWNSFGDFLNELKPVLELMAKMQSHQKEHSDTFWNTFIICDPLNLLWRKKLKMHDIMLMKHSNKYNIFQAGRVGKERERKVSRSNSNHYNSQNPGFALKVSLKLQSHRTRPRSPLKSTNHHHYQNYF